MGQRNRLRSTTRRVTTVAVVTAALAVTTGRPASAQVPRGYAEWGEMCAAIQQEVLGPYWSSYRLAQVEVESGWRPNVCSAYACGLTQFTPATQRDMEARLGVAGSIMDPEHACLLQAHYIRIIAREIPREIEGWLPEQHWVDRVYNGGAGRLIAEWNDCGRPSNTVAVEPCRRRAVWAWRENTEYPWKITERWGKYLRLGWPR